MLRPESSRKITCAPASWPCWWTSRESLDGGTAVVVSHDAVNRIALASLDPCLDEPAFLPQDTGCFNTVEYHKAERGVAWWSVLNINEVPFDDEGRP